MCQCPSPAQYVDGQSRGHSREAATARAERRGRCRARRTRLAMTRGQGALAVSPGGEPHRAGAQANGKCLNLVLAVAANVGNVLDDSNNAARAWEATRHASAPVPSRAPPAPVPSRAPPAPVPSRAPLVLSSRRATLAPVRHAPYAQAQEHAPKPLTEKAAEGCMRQRKSVCGEADQPKRPKKSEATHARPGSIAPPSACAACA